MSTCQKCGYDEDEHRVWIGGELLCPVEPPPTNRPPDRLRQAADRIRESDTRLADLLMACADLWTVDNRVSSGVFGKALVVADTILNVRSDA